MGGPGSGRRRTFEVPAETFTKCPAGHDLPNVIDGLECSGALCAAGLRDTIKVPVSGSHALQNEEHRLELDARKMLGKEALRNKLIPIPEGLEGAAAESYVEAKLTNLSVVAVAELEWQLRFGSDSERAKAAEKILDATGHGKKDRTGGSTQLIIVNGVIAGAPLPWAKPAEVKVVDASAAKALP